MAKSGWKKYDKLPARVGLIDVDALRFELAQLMNKFDRVQNKLEEAIILNKKKKVLPTKHN